MNAVVCSSLRNDLEQQSQTCLIMRARGCMYGSPTELSPLLALAHPQLPCPHFSQSPPFPALLYLEDFWMDGLVHEIRDRGGADGAKPYCVLQESLQQQSLAQSMLSYAASSCCTIVPKCEKLHFTTKIYYQKFTTKSGKQCLWPSSSGPYTDLKICQYEWYLIIFSAELLTRKYLAP